MPIAEGMIGVRTCDGITIPIYLIDRQCIIDGTAAVMFTISTSLVSRPLLFRQRWTCIASPARGKEGSGNSCTVPGADDVIHPALHKRRVWIRDYHKYDVEVFKHFP